MSKALVIKGANFLANRIEQISISDPIPCTGISLSNSTLTFTALDATVTLIATKTPVNSTDQIVWSSSNEGVATVVDGVVTCTGVGTAIITAMCGTRSAICAVSATVTINLDEEYFAENNYVYSGSLELPTKNHIGRTASTQGRLYYSTVAYGTYHVFVSRDNVGKYAIPLPNGATKCTITTPESLKTWTRLVFCDVNERQTYVVGSSDGDAALGIGVKSNSNTNPVVFNFSNIADSANGFILSIQGASDTDASTVSGTTTITFE